MVKKKNISNNNIFIILGALLILFALYNIVQTSSFNSLFNEKLSAAKEAARPAELNMIIIEDGNCDDCFDIQTVVASIKKSHVNIISEENLDLSSSKAQVLIQSHDIEKVPTVLLFGETNKTTIKNMGLKADALVFTSVLPPYTDAETNEIMGLVSSIIVEDSACENCLDLNSVLVGLQQAGVSIVDKETVDRNSARGQSLIETYKLETLPTAILSSDLSAYMDIVAGWSQLGTVKDDGSFATHAVNPPYVDLTEDRIVGLIDLIILNDKDCTDCYKPEEFHKPILARMGAVFENEKTVDISSSEGQSLLDKYSITKVPTIIIEGEVDVYTALVNAWEGVGSVEDDGAYVFRSVEVSRQKYKDLSTGEIVQ